MQGMKRSNIQKPENKQIGSKNYIKSHNQNQNIQSSQDEEYMDESLLSDDNNLTQNN
jgi:hypothetical protein